MTKTSKKLTIPFLIVIAIVAIIIVVSTANRTNDQIIIDPATSDLVSSEDERFQMLIPEGSLPNGVQLTDIKITPMTQIV